MRINQIGGAFGAPALGIPLANSAKLFSAPPLRGYRSLPAVSLGTALVVVFGFYRLQRQEMRLASLPSLLEYRSGLPKRSRALAPQRLPPFHMVDCIQLLFEQASVIWVSLLVSK